MALPPGYTTPAWFQLLHWVLNPVDFLERGARRWGGTFTTRLPGTDPIVVVSDPQAIRDIFLGPADVLAAGEGNFVVEPLVGPGSLLLLDGDRHLHERRLMLPPFHGERMKTYGETMRACVDIEIDRWRAGDTFPIHEAMQRITLDVVIATVFGVQDPARRLWWRERLSALLALATSPWVMAMAYALRARRMIPLLRVGLDPIHFGPFRLDLGRVLPTTRMARLSRDVRLGLSQEIHERRAHPGDDILSLLIQARDDAGHALSETDLQDQMLTLLVAGHETTATTLTFAVQDLLRHPQALARIQQSAYRTDAIKETLRLTPIVPLIARRLKAPFTAGGIEYPTGVILAPSPYLVHRRAELGPDRLEYRPGRFETWKPTPYEYLPFGGGVRRCLGAAFANAEMHVVLEAIFSRATLRLVRREPARVVRRGVTLYPAGGVPVKVVATSPFR